MPAAVPGRARRAAAVRELRDLLAGPDTFGPLRPDAPDADVFAVAVLLAVAGVEVATTLTANTVEALLDHPEQWQRVCAEPELAAAAVAETMRYSPPIRLENRIAEEEVEYAGTAVPADGQVVVAIGAANRDPGVFTEPDRFDLSREPGPVLDPAEGATPVWCCRWPGCRRRPRCGRSPSPEPGSPTGNGWCAGCARQWSAVCSGSR
ncbi:cytochrome P450 [Micromonospora sp. BRA006-A]|nr:cytochrome P450 [Micromonospora sp. BRA006-A]